MATARAHERLAAIAANRRAWHEALKLEAANLAAQREAELKLKQPNKAPQQ